MRAEVKRKMLIGGLLLGLFFASLDQTVVGTAMPRIISDLGGLSIMTWVTTVYMLTSTTIVPIAGKLADIYGRRVVYITGIMIFMGGSALCGISHNMTQLIIFRGLQGVGGGIMMPLAMTIVGDIFPPEQRGKWQGLMGAMFGLSSVVGPTIGGWMVDYISWHWVFYVNLPIGALAAVAIFLGLQGDKRLKDQAVIDYAGAASLVTATVFLLLGLNLGGTDYPWLSWPIAGMLGISAAAWLVFLWVEQRATDPIFSLGLFRSRTFAIANLVGFLMGLGMFGSIMFLPLFLQGVIGVSATASGNTMIPMMVSLMLTSIIGGRFAHKVSFRTMFATGMLFMAGGFYLLSTMTVETTRLMAIAYIVVLGVGMGLVMPTVTLAVQSAFTFEQRGVATSAAQFFRSIGGTLGMSVLGVVFNLYSARKMETAFFPSIQGMPGTVTDSLDMLLAKAPDDPHSLFNMLLSPETLGAIPADVQQILLPPLKMVLAESLQVVFFTAMFVAIAGFFTSLLIGKAGLKQQSGKYPAEQAGATLLAEGIAAEVELTAEMVPDLITEEREDK